LKHQPKSQLNESLVVFVDVDVDVVVVVEVDCSQFVSIPHQNPPESYHSQYRDIESKTWWRQSCLQWKTLNSQTNHRKPTGEECLEILFSTGWTFGCQKGL
jgi:hypothetical protein